MLAIVLLLAMTPTAAGQNSSAGAPWAELTQFENERAAAAQQRDGAAEAGALGEIGLLQARAGRLADAQTALEQSVNVARGAGATSVLARSLYNLALLRGRAGDASDTLWVQTVGVRGIAPQQRMAAGSQEASFSQAASTAWTAGDYALSARAYAQVARSDATQSAASLAAALNAIGRMPLGAERVEVSLLVADAAIEASDDGASVLGVANTVLTNVVADAHALSLPALEGYGRGMLARVAARNGAVAEALALTRQARFLSETEPGAENFVWIAQEAALLSQSGDIEAALAAYQRAAQAISDSRAEWAANPGIGGQSSYRTAAGPILAAYAELLLSSASGGQAQARMRQARTVMEAAKTLQLDQYFQDECITQLVSARVQLEDLPARVAVVYPVLLADRIEILVSTNRGMERSPLPIDRFALEADARALRTGLRPNADGRIDDSWRGPSQRLYAAIVAPILPMLRGHDIDTIVFAPDGVLRGVPLAALHDGEHFLVERYAIANALSLALVDPRPLAAVERRALVAGVSDAVHALPALPSVVGEVQAVHGLSPGAAMLNREFTRERFASAIASGRYTIAHLATHASFGESAATSFIQAHDQRMSLAEMETIVSSARVRGAPIELLVLSACETAAGDDNAVLGIAGVAYRAGARAVLASLWAIPDQSTARLMPGFYGALLNDHATKAQALRSAQMALIADPATAHPYYWSAFVLIGNWL